jgi:type II secretory pathway component PulC
MEVEPGLIDLLRENVYNPFVSVIPVSEDGQVTGIRLGALRPDSLLGCLRLENGDLIRTINGIAATSPENVISAIDVSGNEVKIGLDRRKERLLLTFVIH